jgi:hypothetical protein
VFRAAGRFTYYVKRRLLSPRFRLPSVVRLNLEVAGACTGSDSGFPSEDCHPLQPIGRTRMPPVGISSMAEINFLKNFPNRRRITGSILMAPVATGATPANAMATNHDLRLFHALPAV